MSDNISTFHVDDLLRKFYSLLEKDCTNSLLGVNLIIYFEHGENKKFDYNNSSHCDKLKQLHVRVKVPINRSGGMKNKAISAEHLLYLDNSIDGYNLFKDDYAKCLIFLYEYVYDKPLVMGSAIVGEMIHWYLNKHDHKDMPSHVIASRGHERPQVILMYLLIYLGINSDGTVNYNKSLNICSELVSDLFRDNFKGIFI